MAASHRIPLGVLWMKKRFSLYSALVCICCGLCLSPAMAATHNATRTGSPSVAERPTHLAEAEKTAELIKKSIQNADFSKAELLYTEMASFGDAPSVRILRAAVAARLTEALAKHKDFAGAQAIYAGMASLGNETAITESQAKAKTALTEAPGITFTDLLSMAVKKAPERPESAESGSFMGSAFLKEQFTALGDLELPAASMSLMASSLGIPEEQIKKTLDLVGSVDNLDAAAVGRMLRAQTNATMQSLRAFSPDELAVSGKIQQGLAALGDGETIRLQRARLAKSRVISGSAFGGGLPEAEDAYAGMAALGDELSIREQRASSVTWLISGYCGKKNTDKAESLYNEMAKLGDEESIRIERAGAAVTLIEHYCANGNTAAARKVFDSMKSLSTEKAINEYRLEAAEVLIARLVAAKDITGAQAVYDAAAVPPSAPEHARLGIRIVLGHCAAGDTKAARALYDRFLPDPHDGYVCWAAHELVEALCNAGKRADALAVYRTIETAECSRFADECALYRAACLDLLIAAYTEAGDLATARSLYDSYYARGDCSSRRCDAMLTLVRAYAASGKIPLAHALFLHPGMEPLFQDSCLLAALALVEVHTAAGAVDKAREIYDAIPEVYGTEKIQTKLAAAELLLAAYLAAGKTVGADAMKAAVMALQDDLNRSYYSGGSSGGSWGGDD